LVERVYVGGGIRGSFLTFYFHESQVRDPISQLMGGSYILINVHILLPQIPASTRILGHIFSLRLTAVWVSYHLLWEDFGHVHRQANAGVKLPKSLQWYLTAADPPMTVTGRLPRPLSKSIPIKADWYDICDTVMRNDMTKDA
jgi:hypothetical protein